VDSNDHSVLDLVRRLEQRVEALEAENRDLRERPAAPPSPRPGDTGPGSTVGRRALLIGAAGAAAGAGLALGADAVAPAPAGAAAGGPVVLGAVNDAAGTTTTINSTVTGGGAPAVVIRNNGVGDGLGVFNINGASSFAISGQSTNGIGVHGKSLGGAPGVQGESDLGPGVEGKHAGTGTGVYGTSFDGTGVVGNSEHGAGIVAVSTDGPGIRAASVEGPAGYFVGDFAQLKLLPFDPGLPSPTGLIHDGGEIVRDGAGDLWYATKRVSFGQPVTWRKLSGLETAGSLHVLPVPVRVYDSRPGTFPPVGSKTPLPTTSARALDLKANGSGVPAGATAVVVTVLLVNAVAGAGNFTIWSNSAAKPVSNTMVWGPAGGRFSTQVVTAVDTVARVKVQPSLKTDLVLDVVGYYR